MAALRSPRLRKRLPELVAKSRRLQIGFLFGKFGAKPGFGIAASLLPQLTQHRSESGMRTGKIGLEADGFAQSGGGFRQL